MTELFFMLNDGLCSIAGAAFVEINATLPTVGLHMRMPGLEEALLKVDGRLCGCWSRRQMDPNTQIGDHRENFWVQAFLRLENHPYPL